MSAEELAFLQRVRARPTDDGPRLIYADWLDERGDPRGQFIRVQCALAQLPADDSRRAQLAAVELQLREEHEARWAEGFKDLVSGYEFRRGFIEEISINAAAFVACGPELFRLAPIRRVRLVEARECFPQVVESSALKKVRELDVCGNDLGNAGPTQLARSSHLRRLEVLDLGFNDLTDRGLTVLAGIESLSSLQMLMLNDNARLATPGVRALADSPHFGKLRHLDLSGNDLNASALRVLLNSKSLRKLETLPIQGNKIGDQGVTSLSISDFLPRMLARHPTLDLRDNAIGPAGARALARSEAMAGVETLDLSGNSIGDVGLEALAHSPHLRKLRKLIVRANRIGDEGVMALTEAPWLGSLEVIELRGNVVTEEAKHAVEDARLKRDWQRPLEILLDLSPLMSARRRRYRREQ
jgi:uncharacterized protein (TIGR02996 family)